jgi:hypothetical protein
MTCDAVRDQLEAGEHSPEIDRHLAACAECRQYQEDFLALASRVRDLPRSVVPARPLWDGIERRLARPARLTFRRFLPLAAALALAAGATLWSTLRRPASEGGPPVAASLAREDTYLAAAGELESALDADRLLPAVAAALRRDLDVLDQALAESREALMRDPGNDVLQALHLSAARRRFELLRRVIQFTSS